MEFSSFEDQSINGQNIDRQEKSDIKHPATAFKVSLAKGKSLISLGSKDLANSCSGIGARVNPLF